MNLRESVLASLFWSGSTRVVGQLLNWAVTIVVIRLLTPADYGLLAMATVFFSVLTQMSDGGLGAALVQARDLDEVKIRRIFGFIILVDVFLFLIQFASAPLIAGFFRDDRLILIIQVMSVTFLVSIFGNIPSSLLARRLDFKRNSLIGLASGASGALSTLLFALAGLGVWALILGNMIGAVFQVAVVNVISPFRKWPSFSFKEIYGDIKFGGQVVGSRLLWVFYSQADMLIGGRLLGKELLGFYSLSMHLASLPVQRISAVVNGVAFPAFARAQHDPAAVPHYILKATRILSFVSFPVTWGMSSISPEFVRVLLGPKWDAAVLPMRLLPLVMPLTILSPFLNSAFQGLGRGGVVFTNVLTASLVLPLAFWIGAHWGLLGLSLAWLIGFPVVFLLNLQRMLPLVGLKLSDMLAAVAFPALAAAGMYGCVAVARQFLSPVLPTVILMVALIVVGVAAFAAITLATNRKGVREVIDLFRRRGTDSVPDQTPE